MTATPPAAEPYETIEADVTGVAHGGHMIARHEGRVIFVRHALPGERVKAVITERNKSFWRADAIEVIRGSSDRVEPRCKVAAVCGGCDFQHVSEEGQLRLLASVVSEQLLRIAQEKWDVVVEPVGNFSHWRTRMDWAVGADGLTGLRQHRSHDIVTHPDCQIAHPELPKPDGEWSGSQVRTVATSTGQRFIVADSPVPESALAEVDGVIDPKGRLLHGEVAPIEEVLGRRYEVSPLGFWQVHPKAAEVLVSAVLDFARPKNGETAIDLYSGVGLFTHFLAEAVGETGVVHAVEGSRYSHESALKNMAQFPQVSLHRGSVEKVLQQRKIPVKADIIIADPPRSGAKSAIEHIAKRGASRIIHIACDPASLARDVSLYRKFGYQLTKLRAFALFPMTHHVECVAMLEPI